MCSMGEKTHKIRVAMVTNDLIMNGISSMIMSYCSNLNKDKFQISILAGEPVHEYYENLCTELGVHVVMLPARKSSALPYYKALYKELSSKKYDIVHIHGNSATVSVELALAWIKGIKIRIVHSHNSTCKNIKVHKMLLPIFKRLYTHGFACGSLAGQWLFGDREFYVIPNGFDTASFKYDSDTRENVRKKLGVEDGFIIGHVGRFNDQKNHPFLLHIFEKVAQRDSEARLLLVGTGPDYESVRQLIQSHPYKERIIDYGETSQVKELYQAMDVFVLPSKYEGLPIVLLEAQMSGLPCVVSDVITSEAALGDHISFLSLQDSLERWADIIENARDTERMVFYERHWEQIKKYDIRQNAANMGKLYERFYRDSIGNQVGSR